MSHPPKQHVTEVDLQLQRSQAGKISQLITHNSYNLDGKDTCDSTNVIGPEARQQFPDVIQIQIHLHKQPC